MPRHAAQELVEEVGVPAAPEDMTVWCVTQGEFGNVGGHFLPPPIPASLAHEHHKAIVEAGAERGTTAELDQLPVIHSGADATEPGYYADFLPQVVTRYVANWAPHCA
ncbi:hypothetical protein ACFXPX_32790 [Kitasatospora sp. NPDC059146]|uniref:hypothetical protein n=1 Tax=unclassified Kitasatospora TaxID=2633591 RepID=UPI00368F4BC0